MRSDAQELMKRAYRCRDIAATALDNEQRELYLTAAERFEVAASHSQSKDPLLRAIGNITRQQGYLSVKLALSDVQFQKLLGAADARFLHMPSSVDEVFVEERKIW